MRNQKFAKQNTAKMGKPDAAIKKKQEFKSPISPVWLGTSTAHAAPEFALTENL